MTDMNQPKLSEIVQMVPITIMNIIIG